MSNINNVLTMLNMMQGQGVQAYKNQHGQVVFAGMSRLTPSQKSSLTSIPQNELLAAMRWQKG